MTLTKRPDDFVFVRQPSRELDAAWGRTHHIRLPTVSPCMTLTWST